MVPESEPPRAGEAAGVPDSSSCVVADDGQDHKLARSRVQAGPRGGAFEVWIDAARQVRPQDELARRGLWSKAMTGDNGVPCPGCGGHDRFAVNTRKNVWQCRASGTGGDAIALAQHIDGTSFLAAVETVIGQPPPGRGTTLTQEERAAMRQLAAARGADGAKKRLEDEKAAARFRERERRAAYEIWSKSTPIAGTAAEAYLALRCLHAPPGARLRFCPSTPLWSRPKDQGGRILHTGPALVAAIEGPDGRFSGVQRIWIDLARPIGKAEIINPETGEILPAKKARGSIKGGTVLLVKGDVDADFPGDRRGARRLYLGEGIETVLSVYCALEASAPAMLLGAEFRAAVDLGNLAGKAAGRFKHPTATKLDKNGHERPVFVPGNAPKSDPDFPLIPIAESVEELWILGDGDSEPIFTQLALERAVERFSRAHPCLTIKLATARPGADFNDVWRALQKEERALDRSR